MAWLRWFRFDHRFSRRQVLALFCGSLAAAAAVGGLLALWPAAFTRADNLLLDSWLRTGASSAPAPSTIVVDIDEASLAAAGQWPWPRYRIATLLRRIASERPAAIALDIFFPEPDRSSLNTLSESFRHDFGVDLKISGAPAGLYDNDRYLGHVLAQTGTVGANYLYFDRRTAPPPGGMAPGVLLPERSFGLLDLPRATGVLSNTPAIEGSLSRCGFVNHSVDGDGVLRRVPLLMAHAGRVHPSLALAAVLQARGVQGVQVQETPDGLQLKAGTLTVPVDRHGQALLRTAPSAEAYPSVSAVDILNGRFSPDAFSGRIVFLGSSAIGLNDYHRTAAASRLPGVVIQAATAENLLHGGFVRQPAWAPSAATAAALLVAAALACLFIWCNSIALLLGGALVGLLPCAASLLLFLRTGIFVSAAAPLLVAAGLLAGGFAARYAIERWRALTWQRQLANAREITIESMASVAETRDPETGAHIKRTQHYVREVALKLRSMGRHPQILTRAYIELLFRSAPLHDIGKVGVPDHILLKPGRLTPQEMEQMKQHADYGRQILLSAAQRIDGENFLTIAADIAGNHHEKWDGSGYPLGLAGEAIPLAARIMAVADVYDALISRRCYKPAFTHEHAMQLIREQGGTAFDPEVLEAFLAIEPTIVSIAARFRDDENSGHVPAPPAPPMPTPTQGTAPCPVAIAHPSGPGGAAGSP